MLYTDTTLGTVIYKGCREGVTPLNTYIHLDAGGERGGGLAKGRMRKEATRRSTYPGEVVEVVGELVLVVLGGARGSLQVPFQRLEELADAQPLLAISSPAHVCCRKRTHDRQQRKLGYLYDDSYKGCISKN